MPDEVTKTEEATKDDEVKLEEISEEKRALDAMLADNDIQKVLQARKENKDIEVLLKEDKEPEKEEPLFDEEGLTETDKNLLGQIVTAIEKKVDPLVERVKGLEGLADDITQRAAVDQVKAVREKYSDFDTYRKDISDLSKELPTLQVEELYVVAKARKNDLNFTRSETFSEKPTSDARPVRREESRTKEGSVRGRKAFAEHVRAAVDNLEIDL